jgi:hypothetical protein
LKSILQIGVEAILQYANVNNRVKNPTPIFARIFPQRLLADKGLTYLALQNEEKKRNPSTEKKIGVALRQQFIYNTNIFIIL